MAFILKQPFETSPGIVVFTHKELRFFTVHRTATRPAIEQLKKRYLFAMHWGGSGTAGLASPPAIDFHLAAPGLATFRDGPGTRIIPLSSLNFMPASFEPDGGKKYWDVICVARAARLKKIDELFRVLKQVLAVRPQTKALLVCPVVANPEPGYAYEEISGDYDRIFDRRERENVNLLLLSERLYPFPLSQTTMAFLYNRCRFLTLFSEIETAPRVFSEALLCGLPVLAKRATAKRPYLNKENSAEFADPAEAVPLFIDAFEGQRRFAVDVEALARNLRADRTVPVLVERIEAIFREMGRAFAGELDLEGLDRKLSSHCRLLPDRMRSKVTDDISSVSAFIQFSNWLTGGDLPPPSRSAALARDAFRYLRRTAAIALSPLRHRLGL